MTTLLEAAKQAREALVAAMRMMDEGSYRQTMAGRKGYDALRAIAALDVAIKAAEQQAKIEVRRASWTGVTTYHCRDCGYETRHEHAAHFHKCDGAEIKAADTTNQNTGHGHVRLRPDGIKARCGGPGLCAECSREAAIKAAEGVEPVVFTIYKSTEPRGREVLDSLHNDKLPWVFDQDPSSGYVASMKVVPLAHIPHPAPQPVPADMQLVPKAETVEIREVLAELCDIPLSRTKGVWEALLAAALKEPTK